MFRAILKGAFSDTQVLAESSCLVAISLGGREHTGEKFAATLELVSQAFKEVTIMIADTLQVHTRAIEYPAVEKEVIQNQLRRERDLWIAENQTIIDSLGSKLKGIINWDQCLAHPDFSEKLALVNREYQENPIFAKAVDSGVGRFVSRFARHKPAGWKFSKDCLEAVASVKYILEESAVLLLWPEKQYNFIVYPHKLNQAMYNLLQRYVHPIYPNLLQSLVVDFKPVEQMIALSLPSPVSSPTLSPIENVNPLQDSKAVSNSKAPFFGLAKEKNNMSQPEKNTKYHLIETKAGLISQQIQLSLQMMELPFEMHNHLLARLVSNLESQIKMLNNIDIEKSNHNGADAESSPLITQLSI